MIHFKWEYMTPQPCIDKMSPIVVTLQKAYRMYRVSLYIWTWTIVKQIENDKYLTVKQLNIAVSVGCNLAMLE